MIDFFANLMIVTGGVFCILLWVIIIIAGLIELIDALAPKKTESTTIHDPEDYA